MKGKQYQQKLPRARKDGLVVQQMPEEVLVYDVERHKAHCLNESASLIWKHCDGKRSVTDLTKVMARKLGRNVEEQEVSFGLDQLARAGLLADAAAGRGLTRREVIRRLGVAAAVSLPVVTSIVSPSAIQAASCRRAGNPCTASVQCCSGSCDTGTGRCL